ncbi:MAG: hypothetical protein DCC49_12435 [Acidobacteria bacterium]|nr:MAG: hypothetical protein DCC49_12435 [Acidobacteriota bacterium]
MTGRAETRVPTHYDVLVVGSGFAGLWAAISAVDSGAETVGIIDKGAIAMSSQSKMSAGATVYCLPGDDLDVWVEEYAEAQSGLSRRDFVREILASSYDRLRRLEEWGVEYERIPGATEATPPAERYLRLPSRGFKNVKMMVRPRWRKRTGGSAVIAAMRQQVIRRRVQRIPHTLVTALLRDDGRVTGVVAVDRRSAEPMAIGASAVVLAASDCSFRGNYACADSVTGDAFRLAYDAGVRLSNMEFLCVNTGSPKFGFEGTGIALRYGGKLVDKDGRQFVHHYHPEGDLAEVSVLVQAMAREAGKGNGPPFFLDLSGGRGSFLEVALDRMGGFMPINIARLKECGTDIFDEPQEWVPAVQTLRGGVRTDTRCESDLSGLFAAGLSQAVDPCLFNGWSSMRAMWSGERAGKSAAEFAAIAGRPRSHEPPRQSGNPDHSEKFATATAPLGRKGAPADEILEKLHETIFPWNVSILKSEKSLGDALSSVESIRDEALCEIAAADPHELAKAHETANMISAAEMFLRSSLARTESRTDHFREDFPETDNVNWLKWINLRRGEKGAMELDTETVP